MYALFICNMAAIWNDTHVRTTTTTMTSPTITECFSHPTTRDSTKRIIRPLTILSNYAIDIFVGRNWMLPLGRYQPWQWDVMDIILFLAVCSCGIVVAGYITKFSFLRGFYLRRDHGNDRKSDTSTVMEEQLRNDKIDFMRRVGYDVYGYMSSPGGFIDDWRVKEFPSLIPPIPIHDTSDHHNVNNNHTKDLFPDTNDAEVYLDYAGAALPTQSQLAEIMQFTSQQQKHVLGNPHSVGPAAARTKQYMEQVTKRILDHFHAHPGRWYGHSDTAITKSTGNTNTIKPTTTTTLVENHPGYEVIFTSGTTDAIRIVAEHFPWGVPQRQRQNANDDRRTAATSSSLFVYAQNSHTSVIGIREVALQRDSSTRIVCKPIDQLIETILDNTSCQSLDDRFHQLSMKTNTITSCNESSVFVVDTQDVETCRNCVKHLLVAPMECNFTGEVPEIQSAFQKLRHINSTISDDKRFICKECQQKEHHQSWYTLLDIAKASSTGPVNLCELNPDFAVVSFYKMFGEPTGLGCLLVKRTAIDVLCPTNITNVNAAVLPICSTSRARHRRHYVGGGSVNIIVPGMDYTVSRSEPNPLVSLQCGTPHFRGIVALMAGFHELDRVGGMVRIRRHTQCLKEELVQRLQKLRHGNGRSVIVIYGNRKKNILDTSQNTKHNTGPIVAFNVVRADGSYVGYNEVSKLAALYSNPIQLRTGCFCNPGACQIALDLSDNDLIQNYEESGHVCGDPIDIINNRPTGAIRISFGKDSTWEDMNAVVSFLQQMFVSSSMTSKTGVLDKPMSEKVPIKVLITELYVYPIKSCAAQRATVWPMDRSSGRLRFDREFALVDASGVAMRLQMYPAMAQLRPVIDLKELHLTIHAPDPSFAPLILELEDKPRPASERKSSTVKVCGNRCGGVVWGDHTVSDWFSRYLGVRCWLARHRHTGKQDGLYEHPKSASIPTKSYQSLSFANEQPLLLVSEHAVKILNDAMRQSRGTTRKYDDSVCSRQFRPSIVIRCEKEYLNDKEQRHVEDSWSRIMMIDDGQQKHMTLEVVGPCARCAMVDIVPMNGSKVGTLRALATYRRSGNAQITFGIFVRASPTTESIYNMNDTCIWRLIREGDILLCV